MWALVRHVHGSHPGGGDDGDIQERGPSHRREWSLVGSVMSWLSRFVAGPRETGEGRRRSGGGWGGGEGGVDVEVGTDLGSRWEEGGDVSDDASVDAVTRETAQYMVNGALCGAYLGRAVSAYMPVSVSFSMWVRRVSPCVCVNAAVPRCGSFILCLCRGLAPSLCSSRLCPRGCVGACLWQVSGALFTVHTHTLYVMVKCRPINANMLHMCY